MEAEHTPHLHGDVVEQIVIDASNGCVAFTRRLNDGMYMSTRGCYQVSIFYVMFMLFGARYITSVPVYSHVHRVLVDYLRCTNRGIRHLRNFIEYCLFGGAVRSA